MPLWHVSHRQRYGLRLWRTGAYSFRVIEPGEPADLLTNYDYVLFHRRYEGALRTASTQIQLTPVVVSDYVRGLEWRHYLEATIRDEATAAEIWQPTAGESIIRRLGPENEVFVSGALKADLQLVAGQKLLFSPGLSLFA